nr:MAG TPA: hypothetical protein [Caudoviricetes sp.]
MTSGKEIKFVDTGCDWVRPIYISKDDSLTTQTARDILIHNRKWKVVCDKH